MPERRISDLINYLEAEIGRSGDLPLFRDRSAVVNPLEPHMVVSSIGGAFWSDEAQEKAADSPPMG